MTRAAALLVEQVRDRRSRRVVFLSHCLLNENTRYLGGACQRGCVPEVVERCVGAGVGMVQLPCPEQEVWGGVLKPFLLGLYGLGRRRRIARWLVRCLLPLAVWYIRLAYGRLARAAARRIADYAASGFTVVGIVGIDGSPTCGVATTIDIDRFVDSMLGVDPARFSTEEQNALVRRHAVAGRGLFIEALQRALSRRRIVVPFLAHDLLGELDGVASLVQIAGDVPPTCARP